MSGPSGDRVKQTAEAEHIGPEYTGDNISAKKTANYVWNSDTSQWDRMTQPGGSSGGGNVLADYGIQAISEDATYKYFFFEDSSANWYVLRKHLTNATFDYAKGTGGYASVYVNSTSGPSGSPTYGSKGTIF